MKSTYFDVDDILSIRVSDKPIVREVSQSWHIHTSYAADGTVVEIVLLDVHKDGQQSIERIAITKQILKSLHVPDTDIEAIWKPKALQKALKQSAEQAQRMAAAFGVIVPYAKTKAVKH